MDHDALYVDIESLPTQKVPLMGIDGVIVIAPRSLSGRLLERLAATGRPLTLLDRHGNFVGRLIAPTQGNVLLRLDQYRAAVGNGALIIARNMVLAKVQNASNLLVRRRRDATGESATRLSGAIDGLRLVIPTIAAADNVDRLRGYEGDAAAQYFGVFASLITRPGRGFTLLRRERRPPRGRMNALLSYLYTLLTHETVAAAESVGLDPQMGFLHTPRPGRPSLALDLVEELRAPFADRLALSLVNRREINEDDFDLQPGGVVYLSATGRRIVNEAWARRRQETVRHRLLREEVPWAMVPHVQARLLARHLRGDIESYPAFLAPE
jgi:CRISPR-associated protein Cas1